MKTPRKPHSEKCLQCGRRVPAKRAGYGFCTGKCADLWRNPSTRNRP